ncbi:MAG TPA: CerR family C-terminal domain-containing protein [Tepidisphaeraceae bacterium]|jgi:AcrR family transcriptional regulator|nr:CerR family C-terminal domain-containing protein [Tepidisphaeraceae bacterium]
MTASTTEIPSDTRLRLLQAAGEIFAQSGFRQATVRDIIERAGVNIAAVNYHFRDKQGLYVEVLRHWLGAAMDKYPSDGGLAADAPAQDRLREFVRSFFHRLMDEGVPAWHGKLMAREMADPTPGVIETIVDTHFRPHAQALFGIVDELLGGGAAEARVRLCAFSVVGQILFYRHCQATICRLAPQQKFAPADVAQIADHVTDFALAGMGIYRAEKNVKRGGRKAEIKVDRKRDLQNETRKRDPMGAKPPGTPGRSAKKY